MVQELKVGNGAAAKQGKMVSGACCAHTIRLIFSLVNACSCRLGLCWWKIISGLTVCIYLINFVYILRQMSATLED
jgi:hypothetical protein